MAARKKARKTARKSGPKGGRPSLYRDEYAGQAHQYCLMGYTDEELAAEFGVGIRTLHDWKRAHPEFREQLRAGKAPADATVAHSLWQNSQDRWIEEEQAIKLRTVLVKDGMRKETERVEVVTVRRFIRAAPLSQIYYLNNRQRKYWRQKHHIEHSGKVDGTGVLAVPMPVDEGPWSAAAAAHQAELLKRAPATSVAGDEQ